MSVGRIALDRYTKKHLESFPLEVPAGKRRLELQLRRVRKRGEPGRRAVLLLHGGNSSSVTFLVPNGGFADYLVERGWDVWLLDWRGSPFVVDPLVCHGELLGDTLMDEIRLFTLDEAAKDVAAGVAKVSELIHPKASLSVLGHCVGGGITSIAIAQGMLASSRVETVALVALGLFFEVPWDGWVKAEDFLLERVLPNQPPHRSVDPFVRRAWPSAIEMAYERWPKAWQLEPNTNQHRFLNRLSFLIGRPWLPECIHRRIDDQVLAQVFGHLHLGIYLHCGQMVRRGYAAPFDHPDIIDRARLAQGGAANGPGSYLLPEHFADLNLTLFSAARNRVWHRDGMDLMYEWLLREARGGCGRFAKHVFPDYGLQEIFWAKNAPHEAYPVLEQALQS
jgi:pimeloyl-ACP methyl ester carboxylesterase